MDSIRNTNEAGNGQVPNSVDGNPRRAKNGVSLTEFWEQEVCPRLTAEQVFTDPAHQFQKEPNKWRGGCPWHKSESGTSFYLDPETKLWRCPGCDIGGGAIQYLWQLRGNAGSPRGRDFVELMREVAVMVGVPFPERELSREEREQAHRRESRRAILEAVTAHCEQTLHSPAGDEARAYLRKRGFTDEPMVDLRLGLYLSAANVEQVLREKGHASEDANAAGVLWPKLEGYITFPWADEYGQPLTIYGTWQTRTPPDGKPKKMALPNPKVDGVTWEQTKRSPLYFDRARRARHHHVVLVEGVTDAALAQAYGDTRVVACVAAELSRQQVQTLARNRVSGVTICLDPDSAGDSGIQSCIRTLTTAGITAYIAPKLPDGQDPDDFIVARGIDAWRGHLDGATHAYRYQAEVIVLRHQTGGRVASDLARESAMDSAVAFAAAQPVTNADQLDRHFWPIVLEAVGGCLETAKARVRTVRAEADNGHAGVSGHPRTPRGGRSGTQPALTLAELAQAVGLPEEHLKSVGLRDLPDGGVGVAYLDGDRQVVKTRTSVEPAWSRGGPTIAYGKQFLGVASAAGYLALVGSEADVWTAAYCGIPALGLPAAKALEVGHVGAVSRLYVVQEAGPQGEKRVAAVHARLRLLAYRGDVHAVTIDGCNSLQALLRVHTEPEAFREHWQAALDQAEQLALTSARPVCLSTVQARKVEWLWDRYVPRGTLTLLDGDPGLGKSFITLEIAARLSRGYRMPPHAGLGDRPPDTVLILNAEDDLARTIRPRLETLGADLDRIHALNEIPDGETTRPPTLPDDLDLIEQMVGELSIVLVIIDPLMAFLGGNTDTHKDSDIRRVLHRVKLLAERTQAAVLVVRHLNKLVNVQDPVYRGGGSIGIIGAARSALLVGKDPNDPENRRVLCRSKGNLCVEPKGLLYSVESHEHSAIVQWHGETDLRGEDLLGRKPAKDKRESRDVAVAFLEGMLANGPCERNFLLEQARERGITEWTLKRAKKEMGIVSEKAEAMDGQWSWRLPPLDEGEHEESTDSPEKE
jgi:DNA primase catalytic core